MWLRRFSGMGIFDMVVVREQDASAQLLLEHGVSVHVQNMNGRTPLHLASQCHHSSIIVLLLKFGLDVDAWDDDNMTPLLLASGLEPFCFNDARATAAVQELLEHGASVHMWNKHGQMPLHLASEHHYSSIVALLLKFGVDVDIYNNDNMTPLHLASVWNPYDYARATAAAQVLLEHGANVYMQNKSGQTPLHLALKHGHSWMVALLLTLGADMDAHDDDLLTSLHFAVHISSEPNNFLYNKSKYDKAVKVIMLLLKHGVNVHMQNNNGETPLQVTLGSGDQMPEVIQLLSEHMQND
jgi:ankyrin repeat protein